MLVQGFQFRAKQQCVARPAVVEGLLPRAVARQIQRALLTVPETKGKHAVKFFERLFHAPVRGWRLSIHLGVGVPAEGLSEGFEFLPKRFEIVNLTVKRDDVAPAGRVHRLMSRQEKDR